MTQANALYPPGGFGAPKNRHGQAHGNIGLPAGTEVFSADTHISLAADIFYERCNFRPGDRATVDCFELTYPAGEKAKWDAIVTRISRSLRPGKGID